MRLKRIISEKLHNTLISNIVEKVFIQYVAFESVDRLFTVSNSELFNRLTNNCMMMYGMNTCKTTTAGKSKIKNTTVSNKAEMLKMVTVDGMNLKVASNELKRDREVVLAAVYQNSASIQFADVNLRGDREIVAAALQENTAACIAYVDKNLLSDTRFILDNLIGDYWSYMHDTLEIRTHFNTAEKVELLLSEFPDFYGDMEDVYMKNADMFLISLKKNHDKYGYGEEFLEDYGAFFCNNEEVMKECYRLFPMTTYNMMSERLKNSESFTLELIEHFVDKNIFKELPEAFKKNKEFLLNAIGKNEKVFWLLNHKFRSDVIFLQDCLYKNPWLIRSFNRKDIIPFNSELREQVLDSVLVLYMVATDGMLLANLCDFNDDMHVVYIALRNNGLALLYADDALRNNLKVIKWAMKENLQALWLADEFMHEHPDLRGLV